LYIIGLSNITDKNINKQLIKNYTNKKELNKNRIFLNDKLV